MKKNNQLPEIQLQNTVNQSTSKTGITRDARREKLEINLRKNLQRRKDRLNSLDI